MAGTVRKKAGKRPDLGAEGVDVAPGVLETIATLAGEGVEGVACVTTALPLLGKAAPKAGLEVSTAEDGTYKVTVHLQVQYGKPIRAVAAAVQEAVADALLSQTGITASTVDVYVDGISFPEQ